MIFFISKDSNWQLYRNEILTKLSFKFNHNIEVLTTSPIKEYIKGNEKVVYKTFNNILGSKSQSSFMPGIIPYIIKNRPDVVLAVNNVTQLTEYFSLILCKLLGIKFVWWTHAYDHNPNYSGVIKKLKDKYSLFFLSKAERIITFSDAGKEYLIQNGVDASKIVTAPNTLDTDKLSELKKRVEMHFDRDEFLSEIFPDYSIEKDPLILLYSGRLKTDKKVSNALNAVKLLNDKGIRVRFFIVGDGEEYDNLKEEATSLGIANLVSFPGFVFKDEEISKYFLASDLFVMPGYVGLAIVHAFSFGLPIITEKVDFHSPEIQYLKHGKNGYFVDVDDVIQLTDLIIKLKKNIELRRSLSKAAKSVVENEANVQNMITKMNKALSE